MPGARLSGKMNIQQESLNPGTGTNIGRMNKHAQKEAEAFRKTQAESNNGGTKTSKKKSSIKWCINTERGKNGSNEPRTPNNWQRDNKFISPDWYCLHYIDVYSDSGSDRFRFKTFLERNRRTHNKNGSFICSALTKDEYQINVFCTWAGTISTWTQPRFMEYKQLLFSQTAGRKGLCTHCYNWKWSISK